MKLNISSAAAAHYSGALYTHEGAKAKKISKELELRRAIMCCLLWEDQFYESGVDIAKRISDLIPHVTPQYVADMAIEARSNMKLRHMPLMIAVEMLKHPTHAPLVKDLLPQIIQRADELTEVLAIYWKDGRRENKKLRFSHALRKGLAKAFKKFDEYALSKYNRDSQVKLKDALFLSHAKPDNPEQAALWKKLIDGNLSTPDTWEVALSSGGDKREHWTRLLTEKKLGAMALLRNLRNMTEAQIDEKQIRAAIKEMKTERVLPFRFISAARYAPQYEPELEEAMFKCLSGVEKLPGKTLLLVDVSGSMEHLISAKSEVKRLDAACGLAMLLREICSDGVEVHTFSDSAVQVPPRRGFALRDAINSSQPHSSTNLGAAITACKIHRPKIDRMIVITDEQSHDNVSDAVWDKSYIINVASYQNGVGYGSWTHIDGWSEAIVSYIVELEKLK